MTAEPGTIAGPLHTTTKRRIDFFHGTDGLPWEEVEEIIRTRQRFVLANYGEDAFEEAPILEPYTEFDFRGYAEPLKASVVSAATIFLDQLEANHDDRHYIRRRPWCPACRGGDEPRLTALKSLSSYLVRADSGRMPKDPNDDELNWDHKVIIDDDRTPQADLYVNSEDLRQMRPPVDLIEGIIPREGVGYITGRDRTLKTFLALDIALNTAYMLPYWHFATPLHAHEPRAVRRRNRFAGKGKVIFAAGEGLSSMSPRMDAWVKGQHVQHYGAPGVTTHDGATAVRLPDCEECQNEEHPDVGHVHHIELGGGADPTPFYVPGEGPLERENMIIRKGVANLHAGGYDYLYLLSKARTEKPDLIVVDTLALASGAADQQAATDMGIVHENARRLADASGGVIILIAHTDKGDNDARGSSVIEDNADFVLHCVREENHLVEVEVAKRKDAEDGWKFAMETRQIELDNGGSSLILVDHDPTQDDTVSNDEDREDFRQRIINYLTSKGNEDITELTRKELVYIMPRGAHGGLARPDDVNARLERAEMTGLLELAVDSRGGKKKTWRLTASEVAKLERVREDLYRRLTGKDPTPE